MTLLALASTSHCAMTMHSRHVQALDGRIESGDLVVEVNGKDVGVSGSTVLQLDALLHLHPTSPKTPPYSTSTPLRPKPCPTPPPPHSTRNPALLHLHPEPALHILRTLLTSSQPHPRPFPAQHAIFAIRKWMRLPRRPLSSHHFPFNLALHFPPGPTSTLRRPTIPPLGSHS